MYRGMYFRGKRSRLTDSRLIILVHGFNVDLEGARGTYKEFYEKLRVQVGPTPIERYGTFLGFYWPGDHQSWPASVTTFPARIPVAQLAGRQLAEFIKQCLRPDQEVFFVAHSLGCRVVLETLYEIAVLNASGTARLATVRGVFLMAGAVPYRLCEDGAILRRRDPKLRDWVIHSTSDRTLTGAFPGGEWLFSEGGGEAIGRHGWPIASPPRWHRNVRTKLDHPDYWKTWPRVIENVPTMLGDVAPHQLVEWPDSSRPPASPAKSLPKHSLKERRLASPLGSGWEILVREV